MLDIGRELTEALYFLQYILAQLLWSVNRALLSVAVIAEDVNTWITTNVATFVELLTNALAGPMGALFVLALTLLGVWYLMNAILPTKRIVDPQKLLVYGFMTFFFFSTPALVIDLMEGLRQAATAGVQQAALAEAEGDIFGATLSGTDTGLPAAIPDVYPAGDGVIGSFDLVAYFLAIGNVNELGNVEFPADFTQAYFPFGDPSTIDLADEADREEAKRQAAAGIERLLFALIAIPTAIADHLLRLALTGAAMLLYAGIPFALMLAFYIYTESFIGAYIRQFINLFIETFLSVIIASITIGLLAVAAQRGIGLYIGAGVLATVILVWRIKGAFRLAMGGMHLFGGGVLTGGATGTDLAQMGRNTALTGAGLGLATVAGGGALAMAAALKADARAGGGYLGTDPEKTDGRVRQLQAAAGYVVGRSRVAREAIETGHEVRSMARNFRDGEPQPYDPDALDFVRVGASLPSYGSSPWMSMHLYPALRQAYGQIGGTGGRRGYLPLARDEESGAPVWVGQRSRGAEEQGSRDTAVFPPPNAPGNSGTAIAANPAAPDSAAQSMPPNPTSGPSPPPPPNWDAAARQGTTGADPVFTPATARDPLPATGAGASLIELAPLTPARVAGLENLAANLDGPAAGQTLRVLTDLVGAERTQQMQAAVAQHGPEAVQAALDAVVAQVTAAQQAGETAAAVLAAYQAGEALPDSPLDRSQLTAVADTVLQPRRIVDTPTLLEATAAMRAAGEDGDRALAARLGSPTHFGPQTGAVRAILSGVSALQLTADQLRDLAAQLRSGAEPEAVLNRQGVRPGLARAFRRDLDHLGDAVVLPQTTQPTNAWIETEGENSNETE